MGFLEKAASGLIGECVVEEASQVGRQRVRGMTCGFRKWAQETESGPPGHGVNLYLKQETKSPRS